MLGLWKQCGVETKAISLSAGARRASPAHLLKTTMGAAGSIASLAAILPLDEAFAISRYNSTSMTCAAIQNALQRERAVIFRYSSRTTPGLSLYDRYVSDPGQCTSGQEVRRTTIPSKDGSGCPVLVCQQGWGHNNR